MSRETIPQKMTKSDIPIQLGSKPFGYNGFFREMIGPIFPRLVANPRCWSCRDPVVCCTGKRRVVVCGQSG
jgi:hypothetical protein